MNFTQGSSTEMVPMAMSARVPFLQLKRFNHTLISWSNITETHYSWIPATLGWQPKEFQRITLLNLFTVIFHHCDWTCPSFTLVTTVLLIIPHFPSPQHFCQLAWQIVGEQGWLEKQIIFAKMCQYCSDVGLKLISFWIVKVHTTVTHMINQQTGHSPISSIVLICYKV